MRHINFLLERFKEHPTKTAIVVGDQSISYGNLAEAITQQLKFLDAQGINSGDVVILKGDYSALSIAMLLALIERACIIVPLTPPAFDSLGEVPEVAPKYVINVEGENPSLEFVNSKCPLPDLYKIIQQRNVPGLVLFTSGSSGKPKAVVHDFSRLIEKFHARRSSLITLNFLLFDHWGGLNTLFQCLSNLCLTVVPAHRGAKYICELIEAHSIELLPATPSFLNMLLISKSHIGHNLASLKLITYGAEKMSESTLHNLRKTFPKIELRQTYGMIELGVLRAKSKSADSLWVKLGGEGYNTRVVDGILQIKANSAMLGYINAESPFTEDGYLITGDAVEVDGDWIKILGRQSDIINIGGQKVYPAEVEAILLDCPKVEDAIVYGEPHPLLGKIVCADVVLEANTNEAEMRQAIRDFCRKRLQSFMIPVKTIFVKEIPQSHRLKRVRKKA
jgi:long-chain acyl-CoA synthetase